MSVQRSCLQSHRHLRRVFLQKAVDSAASPLERCNIHSLPDTEASRSLRSHQTLMPGKAQDIRLKYLHIHRIGSCCLGNVGDKKKAVFFTELPHSLQIHHISCHIGSMGTDHRLGVFLEICLKFFIFQPSQAVAGDKGHIGTLLCQMKQRP